jgi:DNA repair photolyase
MEPFMNAASEALVRMCWWSETMSSSSSPLSFSSPSSSSSPPPSSPSPPLSSSSPSLSSPSSFSSSLSSPESVQYIPIHCKSVIHGVSGIFPFKWDINVYRGCEHGCKYCYALYSHQYLKSESELSGDGTDAGNYYRHIYVKTNIAEQLEKELSRPGRKKELINLGGVCDCYQPAEKEFELMPEVLKLMIQYKNPIVMSTKSDLILRDFDLIDELSQVAFVNIASSIITMDEKIRKLIEPAGVSSENRFKVLKKFKETNAAIGVHTMPILPFLTDSPENLEQIFSKTKEAEADYILANPLSLKSQTRKYYFGWLSNQFPHLYEPTRLLYKNGGLDKAYTSHLYQKIVGPLLQKYSLSIDYMKPILQNIPAFEKQQKTLFDF